MAERLRICFEQLGPAFMKLGQMLAMRPDLVPPEFAHEFKKLQDQAAHVPNMDIQKILKSHFGAPPEEIFQTFEPAPLAAASIAQVHRAVLQDGSSVVVKIQRPGIEKMIFDDVRILQFLAELLDKYVPEARIFNPKGIVEEFRRALVLEINFVVEANNIRRFSKNFASDDGIKIPRVYSELSGRQVLVMEALEGLPLSHPEALRQEGINREIVLRRGLMAYLKMVYSDGLFHGDLHPGNIFVMPNNQLGLVDFGVVGRLNRKTQGLLANMFLALADEDYDRMVYLYIDLAPFADAVDVDQFARDIRDLIAPYYGLTMKDLNLGHLLIESTGIASRHGITLPAELVLYFKSIVAIESLGRLIQKDFDFLAYSLEFSKELLQARYNPQQVAKDVAQGIGDARSLLALAPRQMKHFLRRINDPQFTIKVTDARLSDVQRSLERASWRIFAGLIAASLILATAIWFSCLE